MIHVELGHVKLDGAGEILVTEAAVAMASTIVEAAEATKTSDLPVNEIAEIIFSSAIMGVSKCIEKEYGIHIDLEEIAENIS